ncbi:glycosyltransferase family 2 protein [Candidatus Curtissbacteria bacterium]|nr:glycosyltransferase family 2 protein [Candidatus Curtissbacteria bacterium]
MKIAIVVLNYNGLADTLECLESLKKLKKDGFEIITIVVDNNSQDGSPGTFSKLRRIVFIKNNQNLGYSGGNNVGIKLALRRGADYILILNNDTLVDQDLLVNLTRATKYADIICPKIYFAPGFEFHKDRYPKSDQGRVIWYAGGRIDWQNILGIHFGVDKVDHRQFSKRKEIDLATGACFLAKRKVFEKIGFFDEKYFLYLEDMDFCVRAKKAGFKILFEPKAVLWHKNASSAGGSGSPLQDYYITRNRLLFAFKYASIRTKLAVFRQTLSQIGNSTKRQAFLDFLKGKFGPGSFIFARRPPSSQTRRMNAKANTYLRGLRYLLAHVNLKEIPRPFRPRKFMKR